MNASRKSLGLSLALAALVLPVLSGCGAGASSGSAAAEAGVIGEFYEQIESEDDASEERQRAALNEGGPQALEPGQRQLEVTQNKREQEAEQEQEWQ
ncbi:MAG: hypothetical protein H0X28_02465 [Solirubrobacterales bacterium]|nr:hypothetical protein [Solirubrobacterales bacterium]